MSDHQDCVMRRATFLVRVAGSGRVHPTGLSREFRAASQCATVLCCGVIWGQRVTRRVSRESRALTVATGSGGRSVPLRRVSRESRALTVATDSGGRSVPR
eukprot:6834133-Prymnesium_polylepis.2